MGLPWFLAGCVQHHIVLVNGGLGSAREPSSEYLVVQAGKRELNRCRNIISGLVD